MTIISGVMPSRFPSFCGTTQGTDKLSPYPFIKLELGKDVTTYLRWIPPGRFLMGSPEDELERWEDEVPQHLVTLSHGYWMADAPCTQAEWLAVMETEPSHFKGNDLPVEHVSWEDCQEYCKRIRLRHPGFEARLPTEAEWEYACRAGTTSAYNDGSSCSGIKGKDPALDKLGWFDENSEKKTHPVRQKEPNWWGLYDMHGNVWEWCEDWYRRYFSGDQVDPSGPASGSERVLRGGSWGNLAGSSRSAFRLRWHPGNCSRYRFFGFRLALGQVSQAGEE
jgi:formylglycine-generating enzyme required for sulfatase activity